MVADCPEKDKYFVINCGDTISTQKGEILYKFEEFHRKVVVIIGNMATANVSLFGLLDECRQQQCEMIEGARVQIICRGGGGARHKPVFLFSEISDREFIFWHYVSQIHIILI